MAEPIAVLALRRKRDQISGTIAHYERLLREAEHDLAHINASLRLFEATGEAADLPPYVDLNRILRRGETTKICMDALAKEGPLDTRQLAMRVSRARAERHETERERRENDRLMAARTRRVGIFTAVLAIIAFFSAATAIIQLVAFLEDERAFVQASRGRRSYVSVLAFIILAIAAGSPVRTPGFLPKIDLEANDIASLRTGLYSIVFRMMALPAISGISTTRSPDAAQNSSTALLQPLHVIPK
jgi:hypothetical protein